MYCRYSVYLVFNHIFFSDHLASWVIKAAHISKNSMVWWPSGVTNPSADEVAVVTLPKIIKIVFLIMIST